MLRKCIFIENAQECQVYAWFLLHRAKQQKYQHPRANGVALAISSQILVFVCVLALAAKTNRRPHIFENAHTVLVYTCFFAAGAKHQKTNYAGKCCGPGHFISYFVFVFVR